MPSRCCLGCEAWERNRGAMVHASNASVVTDIIGHESEAISAHYTHIDEETKRRAVALLPGISTREGRQHPPAKVGAVMPDVTNRE